MPTQYLYGASVNSIQKFITETGKLKEIIGASEWVEGICTDQFKKNVGSDFKDTQLILGAAGKIHYLFNDKETCERVVKHFPKYIFDRSPDIHFSQAVVVVNESLKEQHFAELSSALKAQRNRQASPYNQGLMIANRSRRTGRPACVHQHWNEAFIDRTQDFKLQEEDKSKRLTGKFSGDKFPRDMNEIANKKEWLAIIHADGNNMGNTIHALYQQLSEGKDHTFLSKFSKALDNATKEAANNAFKEVLLKDSADPIPMRPMVLGGDDLTIIIRGDLAIDYAASFLKHFEKETKEAFQNYGIAALENGFTACAGIAYIKPNYPIHYGVNLAEKLTKYAKSIAKNISKKEDKNTIPSCLAFHKVQSSFVESMDVIIERELSVGKEENQILFNYGPYFLNKQKGYATVDTLKFWTHKIKQEDAPKSSIRNWLNDLHINQDIAEQSLRRIINTSKKERYVNWLQLDDPIQEREKVNTSEKEKVTHLYDVLTVASIG